MQTTESKPVYFVLVALLALNACFWSKEEPKPEATEVPSAAATAVDEPEGVLFDTARNYYYRGLYSVAKESFGSLKNSYPLGAYADFAELKLADADFATGDYAAAALLYENFLRDHPSSEAVPYAILRAARSYDLAQRGLGRDASTLSKALEYYEKLERTYPGSIYAEGAAEYKQQVYAKLAAHEHTILDFYKRTDKEAAYAARLKEYESKWAHYNANQAETAQESPPPVEERALVTPVAKPSLHFAKRKSAEPPVIKVARGTTGIRPRESNAGVHKIECKQGLAFLHVTPAIKTALERELERGQSELIPTGGKVAFDLPEFRAERATAQNCFGDQDLSIDAGGKVELSSARPVRLMTLANPPRVVLMLK